jgi:hypothetical protein
MHKSKELLNANKAQEQTKHLGGAATTAQSIRRNNDEEHTSQQVYTQSSFTSTSCRAEVTFTKRVVLGYRW